MTPSPARATEASLPQLSGRLLWSYRLAWGSLAIGALSSAVITAFQFGADPVVAALRLTKSAILLCVAAILLHRRNRDSVAALVALAFLTWTITSNFDFGTAAQSARLLDRFRFLFFALALLLFPDGQWQPRWTRIVAMASAAIFLIGVGEAANLLHTQFFLPLAIPCVLAGIGSLAVRFRRSSDYGLKQQLKWVALGLVAGIGLILSARAGAEAGSRAFFMPILWEAMFQAGIIVVALGFLVSMLRYRLFDAETVITRSASYAALTIAVVATFGGTEAVIQNLGQLYLGMNVGSVSGGMAAAVAAVLLNPLHERISGWAEERFQPDLAKLRREAPELLSRLATSASTRVLGFAFLPHVNAATHAKRSAIVLGDRVLGACGVPLREASRWWRDAIHERDAKDCLFPVRLSAGHSPTGSKIWLLLGPRPDGTLYGREDLDAVRSTFPELRHALTAALMREALNGAMDRREERLRREIEEIRAMLSKVEMVDALGLEPRTR